MEKTDENYVPEDVLREAEEPAMQILTEKSRDAYDKEFKMFESWLNSRKIKAPSSLWTKYSMVRSTIHLNRKIDISKYGKLTSFLTRNSQGYKPKKSKALERPEIEKFLNEVPDDEYLLMKGALIMGISGACRCDELVNLKIENIQDKGKYFHVVLPNTKTKKSRSFTILEEGFPVNPINLGKKYMSLRSKNTSSSRFFLQKWEVYQPVCGNKYVVEDTFKNFNVFEIGGTSALHRSLPEKVFGDSFGQCRANMTTFKRHGGWKSSTVAKGYLEESVHNKIQIAEKIQGSNASASSSTISSYTDMRASGSTIYESDGIYLGSGGISYMFYHLSKVPTFSMDKEILLQKALQYIQPALRVSQCATKHPKDIPSLILGPAGIYAVAAALYHSTGDENQSRHYREQYYEAARYCLEPNFLSCGSDELFVGRAGYIMGALWLAKETNTNLQKNDLFQLCKVVLQSGRNYARKYHCSCPLMFSYYKVEYLGASHGMSSILQCILSVPGYLEENPSDQVDVLRSIDYLLNIQSAEGNFPAATDEVGDEYKLVHWCHGAGGVFFLMAKAYLMFHEEKYLLSCKKMADLIWRKGLLKKGPGICHGVAGNGYVFLIMYRLTSEPEYLYRAICFYEFMETETFQNNARTPDSPYSLYEGVAGTVCFMADLTHPQQAVFPFSDVF